MNVFYTNDNPLLAARDHCLVLRNKMIIEHCQLLSTVHHVLDGDRVIDGIYKKTHQNHPSAVSGAVPVFTTMSGYWIAQGNF